MLRFKTNTTNTKLRQKLLLVFSGIITALVVLEFGLRLGGFIFLSLQEYRNQHAAYQKGTYRIMCIGESTTALGTMPGGEDAYPAQLERILNTQGMGIKFQVINKGIPGTQVSFLVSQLAENIKKYHPDMIIAMMGINDATFEGLDSLPKKESAVKSLRVYKLAVLLQARIQARIELLIARHKTIYTKLISAKAEMRAKKEEGDFNKKIQMYKQQGAFAQAEEIYQRMIERNPRDGWVYDGLGWLYKDWGKSQQAIAAFKKAIEFIPESADPLVGIGQVYRDLKDFVNAEQAFTKALAINPYAYATYNYLEWTYRMSGKPLSYVEDVYKKAKEFISKDSRVYIRLGWCYCDEGRFAERDEEYRKALAIDPVNTEVGMDLGYYYALREDYLQAEPIFKNVIAATPRYDRAYGSLAIVYNQTKHYDLMVEYYTRANGIRSVYYPRIMPLRHGYKKTKEEAEKYGIKLVCVQYPMYPVSLLKEITEGTEGVVFVDNENLFKDAVKKSGYWDYFCDMFGGEFGHCRTKGNRLLAENVAQVIRKEVFHR